MGKLNAQADEEASAKARRTAEVVSAEPDKTEVGDKQSDTKDERERSHEREKETEAVGTEATADVAQNGEVDGLTPPRNIAARYASLMHKWRNHDKTPMSDAETEEFKKVGNARRRLSMRRSEEDDFIAANQGEIDDALLRRYNASKAIARIQASARQLGNPDWNGLSPDDLAYEMLIGNTDLTEAEEKQLYSHSDRYGDPLSKDELKAFYSALHRAMREATAATTNNSDDTTTSRRLTMQGQRALVQKSLDDALQQDYYPVQDVAEDAREARNGGEPNPIEAPREESGPIQENSSESARERIGDIEKPGKAIEKSDAGTVELAAEGSVKEIEPKGAEEIGEPFEESVEEDAEEGVEESAEAPVEELTEEPAEKSVEENAGMADQPISLHSIGRGQSIDEIATQRAETRLANGPDYTPDELNADGTPKFGARLRHSLGRAWRNSSLAREYYRTKYRAEEREAVAREFEQISQDHFAQVEGEDGQWRAMTAEEIAERAQTDSSYALYHMMVTKAPDALREAAGETHVELDPNSQEYRATKNLVARFATRNADGGWAMTAEEFQREAAQLNESLHGRNSGALDDYLAQALYVRGRVEHAEGIENTREAEQAYLDQLLSDMKIYSSEANESVNTEARHTRIDELVRRYENRFGRTKVGSVVRPEIVAGAAGAVVTLANTTASKVARFAVPIGGAVAAGAISAAREGERTSIAYASYNRAVALGADEANIPRMTRFNEKLAETVLNMESAQDIITGMASARESGDAAQMQAALNDYYLRQGVGARERVDFIRYSAPDQVNIERNNMEDAASQLKTDYINAMRQANPSYGIDDYNQWRQGLEVLMDQLASGESLGQMDRATTRQALDLYVDMNQKQRVYRKLHRKRMLSAGAKSAARSLILTLGAQELQATFDPSRQSLVELINGQNNDAQSRTLLSDIAHNQFGVGTVQAPEINWDQVGTGKQLSNDDVERLRAAGYRVDADPATTHTETVPQSQTAREFLADQQQVTARHWMHNGTSFSDGRELSLDTPASGGALQFRINGGASGGGLNYSQSDILSLARNGQLKFAISPTGDTTGQPFILSGHLEGNTFVADDPGNSAIADAIRNNTFANIEVVDTSNLGSGSLNVFATESGSGLANEFITEMTNTVSDPTTYTVTPPDNVINAVSDALPVSLTTLGVRASARGYYVPGWSRRQEAAQTQAGASQGAARPGMSTPTMRRPASTSGAASGAQSLETSPGATTRVVGEMPLGGNGRSSEFASRRGNLVFRSIESPDIQRTLGDFSSLANRLTSSESAGSAQASFGDWLGSFSSSYRQQVDRLVPVLSEDDIMRRAGSNDEALHQLNARNDRARQRNQWLQRLGDWLGDLATFTTNNNGIVALDSDAQTRLIAVDVGRGDVDKLVDAYAADAKQWIERSGIDTSSWPASVDDIARLVAYDRVVQTGEDDFNEMIDRNLQSGYSTESASATPESGATNPTAGSSEESPAPVDARRTIDDIVGQDGFNDSLITRVAGDTAYQQFISATHTPELAAIRDFLERDADGRLRLNARGQNAINSMSINQNGLDGVVRRYSDALNAAGYNGDVMGLPAEQLATLEAYALLMRSAANRQVSASAGEAAQVAADDAAAGDMFDNA